MGGIEWAMWGNEQGIGSAIVLLAGGILAVAGQFKRWEFGAFAIALSALILLIEYPRSMRAKGRSTRQRRFQKVPAFIVKALGPVGRNYYCRFVIYLLACVPCVFQLATVLGALSLLVTSIIYLKAATNGEKWLSGDETPQATPSKAPSRSRPPSMAPPRLKKREVNGNDNNGQEVDGDELYVNVPSREGSRI